MKIEKDKKVHWQSDGEGATHSRGTALQVETTALAAYALLKTRYQTTVAHNALDWIIENKDARGTWHSTQATVYAMRALLAGTGRGGSVDADLNVTVAANGKLAKELKITPETSDVFRLISLRDIVREGRNSVALETSGKGDLAYQIVSTHYMPWDRPKTTAKAPKPLEIAVKYDASQVKKDELLRCEVTIACNRPPNEVLRMTIVDLGIPPGFQVLTEDFEALVEKGVIQRFTLTGRQVILYFDKIRGGKGVKFQYRLRAKYPVRAKTPATQIYQYYEPEVRDEAQPVVLTVI